MNTNDLRALVAEWAENAKAMDADGWYTAAETWRGAAGQLQAALDAQAGGWLPIESAPRHGLLLTFHPRFGQRVMRPDPVSAGWFLDDTGDATQAVTHWMPLPAGPVEGGGNE